MAYVKVASKKKRIGPGRKPRVYVQELNVGIALLGHFPDGKMKVKLGRFRTHAQKTWCDHKSPSRERLKQNRRRRRRELRKEAKASAAAEGM